MSTAVMPSSLYELNDINFSVLKQQDAVSKLGWDSGSEGDVSRSQQLPLSLMTTFILDNINQQHRRLERTQSEPAKVPSLNVNTSRKEQSTRFVRYKTELCRPYEESGTCKYGEKCQFAHGGHELRCLVRHPKYKTELCRTFHSVGFCPYGPRCHFIHNAEEARSNGPPSGGKNRPRPLSLGGHNLSSESSLASTSPPSSLGSISPPPQHFGPFAALTPPHSPHSPPPPPASPESRLPVFNRISAPGTPSAAMANNLHSHGHHSHVPLLLNMRFGSGELSV
ncbi:Zinc finger C-x8-C-x5-C-x3-H type (and similar) [Nesidiocoris tenuis]|uniref:Zinc finger C-x8-C-x5-C-x3-H type (And similar) n=1 Tax=Nesidiocoris tenuis TaxID=355587 RepID=A0ABN7BA79_9HEMI|nr:Zinc finger C-x8-C-x5-C-x3-H type (and similar) [Nesidiocoris tenuis]